MSGMSGGMAIGQLISQGVQNLHNRFASDRAYNFARQQWHDQRYYADTHYRRMVADLKAAGLNPMLAVAGGSSGGGQPHGVSAGGGSGTISGDAASSYSAAQLRSKQMQLINQEILNKAAEADRTRAETAEIQARTPIHPATRAEIEARTPTHAWSIETMKQQIGESAMRIERIIAETDHQVASAAEARQRTINLKETVPQIRATVDQLRTLSEKQTAGTQEIRQRIRANLPELEAAMRKLDNYAKELAQPGREHEATAQQGFIGALGAVLRILNPLRGMLP